MAKQTEAPYQHVSLQDVGHVQSFNKQTFAGVGEKAVGGVLDEQQRDIHHGIRDAVFSGHYLR
jgi:hypothetical protein